MSCATRTGDVPKKEPCRNRSGPAPSARPVTAKGRGEASVCQKSQSGRPKSAAVQGERERTCLRVRPGPSPRQEKCSNPRRQYSQGSRKCGYPGQKPSMLPASSQQRGGVKFADEMGLNMESCRAITPPGGMNRSRGCSQQQPTYPIMPGSSNVPFRKLAGVSTIILRPGEINPNETTIIDISGLDENDPVDIGMPTCPIQVIPDPPGFSDECNRKTKSRRSYAPPPSKRVLQENERRSQVCQRTQGYRGRKTEYRDNPLTAEELCEIEESKMKAAAWKDQFMKQRDRERRGLGDNDLCDIEQEMPSPLPPQDPRSPSPDPWDCSRFQPSPDNRNQYADFAAGPRTTSTPQGGRCSCSKQGRNPQQFPQRSPPCPPRQSPGIQRPQNCRRSPQGDPFEPAPSPPRQSSPYLMGLDSPEQDLLGLRASPRRGRGSPSDLVDWDCQAQPPLPFDITCPAETAANDLFSRMAMDMRGAECPSPQQQADFLCHSVQGNRTRVVKVAKCPDDPSMAYLNTTEDTDLGILDLDNMDLGNDSNWLTGPPPRQSYSSRCTDMDETLGILENFDDDLCAPRQPSTQRNVCSGRQMETDNYETPMRRRTSRSKPGPRDLPHIQKKSRMLTEQLERMGNGGGGLLEDEECPFNDEFAMVDAEFEEEGPDILGLNASPVQCMHRSNAPGPYTRELATALDSPTKYDDLLGLCRQSPERQEQYGPAAQELFDVCAEDAALVDLEDSQCPPPSQQQQQQQRYGYSRDLFTNVEWNPQVRERCEKMYGRSRDR